MGVKRAHEESLNIAGPGDYKTSEIGDAPSSNYGDPVAPAAKRAKLSKPLGSLPPELVGLIATHLPSLKDLKNFRLSAKYADAAVPYALVEWERDIRDFASDIRGAVMKGGLDQTASSSQNTPASASDRFDAMETTIKYWSEYEKNEFTQNIVNNLDDETICILITQLALSDVRVLNEFSENDQAFLVQEPIKIFRSAEIVQLPDGTQGLDDKAEAASLAIMALRDAGYLRAADKRDIAAIVRNQPELENFLVFAEQDLAEMALDHANDTVDSLVNIKRVDAPEENRHEKLARLWGYFDEAVRSQRKDGGATLGKEDVDLLAGISDEVSILDLERENLAQRLRQSTKGDGEAERAAPNEWEKDIRRLASDIRAAVMRGGLDYDYDASNSQNSPVSASDRVHAVAETIKYWTSNERQDFVKIIVNHQDEMIMCSLIAQLAVYSPHIIHEFNENDRSSLVKAPIQIFGNVKFDLLSNSDRVLEAKAKRASGAIMALNAGGHLQPLDKREIATIIRDRPEMKRFLVDAEKRLARSAHRHSDETVKSLLDDWQVEAPHADRLASLRMLFDDALYHMARPQPKNDGAPYARDHEGVEGLRKVSEALSLLGSDRESLAQRIRGRGDGRAG